MIADRVAAQQAAFADLRAEAKRISVSGLCFDLGDGNLVRWMSMNEGPTPVGSSTLFMHDVRPIAEEDVEDFHGGWAEATPG